MALGSIGHERNFVYLNEDVLYDVQSVNASLSAPRTTINVAGMTASANVPNGFLQGSLSIERSAVTLSGNDPFTKPEFYANGFSGIWEYINAAGEENYFAITSGYLASYTFNASIGDVPTISNEITAFGNKIGQIGVSSFSFSDGKTGDSNFTDAYAFPRKMTLTFPDGATDAVQSFNLSFSINRQAKPRLGQMKAIPETFISYPIEVNLKIDLLMDEYSAPAVESLSCAEGDQDISLELLEGCAGTPIRNFNFTNGRLVSVSEQGSVNNLNTATLNYVKLINDVNDIGTIL